MVFMMAIAKLLLLISMLGQVGADTEVPTINDTPAARLEYMQVTGDAYQISDADGKPVTFRKEPVLRFTNPVSGVVDGGLFVWEDQATRPVAMAQIFIVPKTDKLWLHEFQSLAPGPLHFRYQGRAVWTPAAPGVELKKLAGAPQPAATPAARLLQMRQIARRFSVKDFFEERSNDELRLMSTPLVRYQDASASDGAIFAYAHGTDPELLIAIEARPDGEQGSTWYVGLAPMTGYAITAELDGQVYWSVERRPSPQPITAIFKNFPFPPQH
jgi:hypothetical protein